MSSYIKDLSQNLNKKIIIVDNDISDLDTLDKRFKELNLPCLSIHYEQADFEALKLQGVRYAFFDLNITDVSFDLSDETEITEDHQDLKRVFNELVHAISEVIDKNNGPYVLIFWTQNEFLVGAFQKYLSNRLPDDFPIPISILVLSKGEFRADNKSLDRVLQETEKFQSLKSLAKFESLVEVSISETISSLLSTIIDKNSLILDPENFDNKIFELFKYIALSNYGVIAYEEPTKAIIEGLLPLLNYNITKSCSDIKLFEDILDSSESEKYRNDFSTLKKTISEKFNISALNSAYHIDNTPSNFSSRGATFNINGSSEYFENIFEVNFEEIFRSNFNDFHKKLVQSNAWGEIQVVITEFSAACDYSQNNDRVNKYIIGYLIPINTFTLTSKIPEKVLRSGKDSMLSFSSPFDINSQDQYLSYSLSHAISINFNDKEKLNYLFTLKKELMDSIGNKYSNHVSRIGITVF